MSNENNGAPSSAPTAGRQSIDTPEFRQMLWTLWDEESSIAAFDGPLSHVNRIIAHIDTWTGRSAGDAVPAPLYSTRQDAERFRRAIALEDNAEALYAAVLSHAPDGNAIRRAFDSDAAPAPGNTAQLASKEE